MTDDAKVTIDGVAYSLSDLSEKALAELGSLRVADQEIARLQQQLALYQTARNAYARAGDTSAQDTKLTETFLFTAETSRVRGDAPCGYRLCQIRSRLL